MAPRHGSLAPCSGPFLALALAAALLAGGAPSELTAQEPVARPGAGRATADTLSLAGIVTQAGGGQPIAGVTAQIEALSLAAVTDAAGRFTILNVPAGRHQVEIRALGYRTVRFTLSVPQSEPIRIAVSPEPLELEGITVEAAMQTAERNLEERRRAYPGAVRVLRRDALERAAGRVSNAVQSAGAFLVDCTDERGRLLPGEDRECVGGGASSSRPLVCIDGRRAVDGVRQLDSYPPESLHLVEVYGGGSMIYAYTHEYMRWQGAGRLPIGLVGC